MPKIKKYLKLAIVSGLLFGVGIFIINIYVRSVGSQDIVNENTVPAAQAAIVLGAYVNPDGRLCDMLEDRVKTAVELYKSKKVRKILMTGDHGRKSYDEVNNMRRYAESLGVPTEDIFMDHAGFSTYDSMYRARDVFKVESAIIVTQNFHLPRAVYIAKELGLKVKGISADKRVYPGSEVYELREILARVKACWQTDIAGSKPVFLGPAIPIDGDGRATHDLKDN